VHKENFQLPSSIDEVATRLALLRRLDTGIIDGIECPNCHRHTVSVWFTHPLENEYRTWFVCNSCSFRMRAQNSVRPAMYTEGRVNHELEAYDKEVLDQKKFGLKTQS
jgi:hypothetical protein